MKIDVVAVVVAVVVAAVAKPGMLCTGFVHFVFVVVVVRAVV